MRLAFILACLAACAAASALRMPYQIGCDSHAKDTIHVLTFSAKHDRDPSCFLIKMPRPQLVFDARNSHPAFSDAQPIAYAFCVRTFSGWECGGVLPTNAYFSSATVTCDDSGINGRFFPSSCYLTYTLGYGPARSPQDYKLSQEAAADLAMSNHWPESTDPRNYKFFKYVRHPVLFDGFIPKTPAGDVAGKSENQHPHLSSAAQALIDEYMAGVCVTFDEHGEMRIVSCEYDTHSLIVGKPDNIPATESCQPAKASPPPQDDKQLTSTCVGRRNGKIETWRCTDEEALENMGFRKPSDCHVYSLPWGHSFMSMVISDGLCNGAPSFVAFGVAATLTLLAGTIVFFITWGLFGEDPAAALAQVTYAWLCLGTLPAMIPAACYILPWAWRAYRTRWPDTRVVHCVNFYIYLFTHWEFPPPPLNVQPHLVARGSNNAVSPPPSAEGTSNAISPPLSVDPCPPAETSTIPQDNSQIPNCEFYREFVQEYHAHGRCQITTDMERMQHHIQGCTECRASFKKFKDEEILARFMQEMEWATNLGRPEKKPAAAPSTPDPSSGPDE